MPSMDLARVDPRTRNLYFVEDFPYILLYGASRQPEGVAKADITVKFLPDTAGLLEDIPFVVTADSPFLSAERLITSGYGIDITDLGPNGQLVISVDSAEILALVSSGGFTGQVEVRLDGTTVAIRGGIDFVQGSGISITAVDDPFLNLVHLTFSLDPTTVSLGDLADADTTGQTAGQVLGYDGTQWKPTWPDRLQPDSSGRPTLLVDGGGEYEFFANGQFASPYDRGAMRWLAVATTADATPTRLLVPGTGGSIPVPPNTALAFDALVVAREVGGSRSGAWRLRGLVARDAGANTVRFVGGSASQELIAEDEPGWDAIAGVDTAVGALTITATGSAATTVRWTAEVRAVRVSA